MTSVQFLLASGLALLLFVMLANFAVVQYGRGAIRSALDQGARVAAITSSVVECERRVAEVLGQLLGGRMGDQVVASCQIGADLVYSSAEAVFPSWTPLAPDIPISMTAQATREQLP